jgi:serine/threonine protein kinase
MEYVDGEPLNRRLQGAPLTFEEVFRIARGVAEALAAAHQAGIVHRDVKPANIMLARGGPVKVLDFAVAKVLEPALVDGEASTRSSSLQTGEGVIVGTLAYMSPEQAEGKPVDVRSDLFSFGVVLYEMLCGERPFRGSSMATLVSAILRDRPKSPGDLRPDVPSDLERVVFRCLEKDPAQRYASAVDLCEDLRRCQERLVGSGGDGLRLRRRAVALLVASIVVVGGLWL